MVEARDAIARGETVGQWADERKWSGNRMLMVAVTSDLVKLAPGDQWTRLDTEAKLALAERAIGGRK